MVALYMIMVILVPFALVLGCIYWPEKPDEPEVCPMCKDGQITLHISGSADQWCSTVVPCDRCGYNPDGLTENVCFP